MKEEGGEEPRRSWRDVWCRIQSKYIARYSQRIEKYCIKMPYIIVAYNSIYSYLGRKMWKQANVFQDMNKSKKCSYPHIRMS